MDGFRTRDSCDFVMKPVEGRVLGGFYCKIKFWKDGDPYEHIIHLNPYIVPVLKVIFFTKGDNGFLSNEMDLNLRSITTQIKKPQSQSKAYELVPQTKLFSWFQVSHPKPYD